MSRLGLLLAAPVLLLAACVPGSAVRMHDLYLYGPTNARLSLFYGGAGELLYQGGTVTLSDAEAGDSRMNQPYAVVGALLVDGKPYLREPLDPLDTRVIDVSRIPFTTDMQVRLGADVVEVVYFDGSDFLQLLDSGEANTTIRVVPRQRLNRLRGLGELSNGEADAVEAALRAGGKPFALAVLPVGGLPVHNVDGLGEQRRTGLYVQEQISTDEAAFRPTPEQLTWEVLARGSQAIGFSGRSFLLVANQDELNSLWNRAYGSQLTVPPLPGVDFRRETIVAVFLGSQSTGGYGVDVTSVSEENDELYLDVAFTAPAPDAITTQALTSPWVMVRVLRGGYNVVWLRDADSGELIGAARVTM